jgi:hypothetical protein
MNKEMETETDIGLKFENFLRSHRIPTGNPNKDLITHVEMSTIKGSYKIIGTEYEEFVNLYGYGIDANDLVKINKLTPAESPEKKAIVDSIVKKNPVMIFDKLLLKLNEQDKIEYIKNTSDFLMAEKEILNNIPPILAGIRTLTEASEIRYTVDVNGRQVIALNDKDAAGELKELEYYCTTFPFATKEFILDNQIINTPEYKDLKENMIELFTKSIANKTYSKVDEINSSPTPATI